MNQCTFCSNNIGENGGKVSCKSFGEINIPPYCAAKILTSEGWERLAIKAHKEGDFERAKLYYERAIETQIPKVL